MNQPTHSRPRVKPTRTVRLALAPSDETGFAVIVITVSKESDTYHVTPLPSDYGAAFEVAKVSDPEGKAYQVCLEGNGGTCDCKGHGRWGRCRHVEALQTLRANGQL